MWQYEYLFYWESRPIWHLQADIRPQLTGVRHELKRRLYARNIYKYKAPFLLVRKRFGLKRGRQIQKLKCHACRRDRKLLGRPASS